jgi:hypothetical protein
VSHRLRPAPALSQAQRNSDILSAWITNSGDAFIDNRYAHNHDDPELGLSVYICTCCGLSHGADPDFPGYFTIIDGANTFGGKFMNVTFRRLLVPPGDPSVDFTLAGCPSYHLIFAYKDERFHPHPIAGTPQGP